MLNLTSQGFVTIDFTDSFAPPVIDPWHRYRQNDNAGSVIKFLEAPSFENYIMAPVNGLENVATDEDLDGYISNTGRMIFHPSGPPSCRLRVLIMAW